MSRTKPSSRETNRSETDLIHQVYDTALDNSLWPEMIVAIVDHVSQLEAMPEGQLERARIESINAHFNRAYAISEKMVDLQERNVLQAQVLEALSCDVTLFSLSGEPFYNSRVGREVDATAQLSHQTKPVVLPAPETPLFATHYKAAQAEDKLQVWSDQDATNRVHILLPKTDAMNFGFPAQADTVLLSCDFDTGAAITEFAAKYRLTGSENRLLTAFAKTSDVSLAAASLGITTGTARQYLKSIYTKSGHNSQADLMRALFFNPAVFLARCATSDALPVRRMLTVDGGRQLEYFSIGPEDGYPVFFFDALAGNSIDSLGHPDRYRPTLNRLGMRLITPCRPGGFRSDFRPLGSLRDYATDVTAICDHIGKHKISLLSYSYGSNAALGVAHALPDMVERVTMASVSYTNYVNADWRNRDMFFQVTNVIGRRWPALLKRLIPFLARSVIQNVHPFAERMLANAQCDHERMILGDHRIRARTSAMVAERTANGFDGVIEEYRLNAQPYDFDVRDITASMMLFHGECDVHNPLMGAKMLAQDAPIATLHVLPDMGHHLLFKEWDWIFAAAMNVDFEMPTKTPLQFA